MAQERDTRTAWVIMGILLVARVFTAASATLIVDEAYAISVAREFSLSFYDHPPISFWAPVVSAWIFGVESELVFRLPAILLGTVTAWVIWRLGILVGGARAGLWTLGLYALAPAFALAGAVMVPDPAVEFGVVLTAYWLVRIVQDPDNSNTRYWIWAGLALAFGLASKYQAGLVPVMALVFAVISPVGRRWFARPGPYVASVLGLAGLSFVLIWNIQNDWISFTYHTGRTGRGMNLPNLGVMAALQLLFLLPPIAVIGAMGIARAFKGGADRLLLALLAVGPIVAFNLVYLFADRSFPHWTMPGWIVALPLAGVVMAEAGARFRRVMIWTLAVCALLEYGFIATVVTHVRTGILTNHTDPIPEWDRFDALDVFGLEDALNEKGYLDGIDLIVAGHWIKAGFMSQGLRGQYPVRVMRAPNHFQFMSGAHATGEALYLHPVILPRADQLTEQSLELARKLDPNAELLEPVVLKRGGRDYLQIVVIRLHIESVPD